MESTESIEIVEYYRIQLRKTLLSRVRMHISGMFEE